MLSVDRCVPFFFVSPPSSCVLKNVSFSLFVICCALIVVWRLLIVAGFIYGWFVVVCGLLVSFIDAVCC